MKRCVAWLAGLALLAPLLLPLAPPLRAAAESAEEAAAESAEEAAEETAEEAETEDAPVDLEQLNRERAARAYLYPVRRRISRYLEAATKAVDSGKPEEGRALLDKLDAKRLNPYERALVYRLHAHLAYFAGDHAAARENFEKVLAEKVLPVREDNRIRFNIAQLYAASQQWNEVLKALDRWARYVNEPDPFVHYLRAVAHYQLEDFDAALEQAKRAVELSPEPLEGWLLILSALYTQKEQYANAVPILEQLVARFPNKKRYWIQLALIFGALENYPRALSLQQLAYLQGLLTEDKELRRLARASLHQNLPYPAAQVIEKGLADGAITRDSEALELLANSWIAAREYEKSLPPLRQAAELAKNGNLYVRLGQVYMQREDWKQAAEVLQQAIAKGELKDPGNAQLLLGIAYYNDQRVDQARSSFARARQHDSTREAADRWIDHLESGGGAAG